SRKKTINSSYGQLELLKHHLLCRTPLGFKAITIYYYVVDDKIWPTGIEYQIRYANAPRNTTKGI
ncbi:MAG: hypothetical protein AAGA86_15160, partial [Bacteroidota bacterium]